MKRFRSKIILIYIWILCCSLPLNAQNRYDKRIHRYHKAWDKLIPTHAKIQFAGDMGLLSFGTGWDYGKRNQWETDILIGILPKYSTEDFKVTLTLKQNYIPWSIHAGKGFSIEPLACGFYFNSVLKGDFWSHMPERYPQKYYELPTKIRSHIFVGQRISYEIDKERRYRAKAIALFYELSTCDIYIISRIGNSSLRPKDYLRLSFGIKMQLF